jgi:hypothetical protein
VCGENWLEKHNQPESKPNEETNWQHRSSLEAEMLTGMPRVYAIEGILESNSQKIS